MRNILSVRAAKAINCNFDNRFRYAIEINSMCINKAIAQILYKAQPDEDGVTIDKISGHYFIKSDGTKITKDAFIKENWNNIFGSIPMNGNQSRARQQVLAYAMERVKSYSKRNKKKIHEMSLPRVHNDKSLYIKDNDVTLLPEENTLRLKTFYGEEIDIKYDNNISQKMFELWEYRKTDGVGRVTTGGNFQLGQKTFVAQMKVEKEALYEPVEFLGFDINLSDGCWLEFNMPSRLNVYRDRPEYIYKLTGEIKRLNRKLKLKDKHISERKLLNEDRTYRPYRTDERRKDRIEWKRLHKELKKEIKKIAQDIINYCIEHKLCLCIDNIASGQKNGTFGQDHLIEWLKTLCEDQRVPFYSIPTFYTSQKCSKCGHIHKKNRNGDEFKCLSCGHEDDSHHNASVNIANQGKEWYNQGHKFSRSNYNN